ncbi:protein NrnU, partial [Caulobacter sp. B11]
VVLWAFAHLMANGDLASVILFGPFWPMRRLIWCRSACAATRRRRAARWSAT